VIIFQVVVVVVEEDSQRVWFDGNGVTICHY
jgi:hypothetical protein